MNTSTTCDEPARRSNAERYVLRQMSAREVEDFEDHFVSCAACQDEVRFVSAVGDSLRTQPVEATTATPLASNRRRTWYWEGGIAALAIAASVVLMVVRRAPDRALTALGAVTQPPVYLGIAVRSAASAPDSTFETAMRAYADRHYADAVSGLTAVVNGGGDSPAARFFLATSFLFEGRQQDAADQYARVLATGEPSYRAEARYYRAKALLRMGQASDAVAELRQLTPADGVNYEMGSTLADSIARLRGRK